MGYYINRPDGAPRGKVDYLLSLGAEEVSVATADSKVETHGVIVVVDNGMFEAAGYAFSRKEFECFTSIHDGRSKRFFVMDREVAEREAK